jgi:magnesium-transporting ATPase (P-type)
VTFGELLVRSLDDFTLRVLLGAGALSLALQAALGGGEAGGWVEGGAILAAVAVVALVTAANDFQKEQQFRALSELSSAADVRAPYPTLPYPTLPYPTLRTAPLDGRGGGVRDGRGGRSI